MTESIPHAQPPTGRAEELSHSSILGHSAKPERMFSDCQWRQALGPLLSRRGWGLSRRQHLFQKYNQRQHRNPKYVHHSAHKQ